MTETKTSSKYLLVLLLIVAAKALAAVWAILYLGIGLGPDEAQYWTWSRHLDWGYYSKPPAIAWQIWLGCLACGQTELGVRIGAVVIGALLAFAVYWLARCCGLKERTSFWAGLTMALSPLGVMSSFLAITDGGMVLFWTLGCCAIAAAIRDGRTPNYLFIGLCVLGGALFKWPMYWMWAMVFALMPFYRVMISGKVIWGVLISLFGLVPSVVWNRSHDWVTFRHVFATIEGQQGNDTGTTGLFHGNFWEFAGSQAVLLSPVIFILLIVAFGVLIFRRNETRQTLKFCGIVTAALLIFYFAWALTQKMQGNWADFAYPTGIVLLSWAACEKIPGGKGWLLGGLLLSVVMCAFAFCIPLIQSQGALPAHPIPYRINPFRHNVGWYKLSEELKKDGYRPEEHFLFSDRYQMCSILSFYGEGQKRAYFLNLHGIRKNQFSFWPGMAQEQKGRTGFFVVYENAPDPLSLEKALVEKAGEYQKLLQGYFKEVKYLGIKPLFISYGVAVKGAIIFECIGYNGKEPADSKLF